jgi:hypothetical protein
LDTLRKSEFVTINLMVKSHFESKATNTSFELESILFYFFWALALLLPGEGGPVIQSSAARLGKPGKELSPPRIELGFS